MTQVLLSANVCAITVDGTHLFCNNHLNALLTVQNVPAWSLFP